MPGVVLPVEPTEYVWRRVPKSFVNLSLEMSIFREAFRPRQTDVTGLSVFRQRFFEQGPIGILLTLAEERRRSYFITQLFVADLISLDLTVLPEEVDELPGHAVIPELSRSACTDNPQWCRETQLRLAVLASRSIVFSPT